MDEERLRQVLERIRRQNINYVKLRGLVSRFMTLNPEADPEAIDWTAVYDDSLSYDELVEAFEKEYPMYRWRETAPADDKQIEDMLVNHILNQVEDLTEESLKSLVNALEERLEALRQAETPASPTEQQPEHTQMQHPQHQPPTMTENIQQPAPQPKVTLKLLASYPFLAEAREVVRGVSFEGLPRAVYKRARERLMEALERGELGVVPRLDEPFVELLSFPVAKAVVHTIDDDWLKRRWALAESARVERLLLKENADVSEWLLSRLLEVRREGEEYALRFTDYLKLVEGLTTDISWKLVNQKLHRGWVFITKTRLIRLIRQKLYQLLYNSFQQTPKLTKIPQQIAEMVADITEELQKIKARAGRVTPVKGAIPPCMKAISDRLADASHTENFVYAAYLVNTGYSIEEIVDVFRKRADFDERIARYQIEHIAGLRGSRVKYRPPSCSRMRELGLCIENGRLCPPNIHNPLQYRPRQQRQPT
ncbi:MAG: hypothetical protein QXJ55_08470 [Candidatus Caldarchaeum sp.]